MAKMGMVTEKVTDPILRLLAYWLAMVVYGLTRMHPTILKRTNSETLDLMARATEGRNADATAHFKAISAYVTGEHVKENESSADGKTD